MQLSRESIIAAAVTILDTYGLADMSMRRVATSLDVAPGALYWHIANKQQLITAIAEEILSPVLVDAPSLTAAGIADLLREAMLSRRDGAELVGAALSQPGSVIRADVEKRIAATLDVDADTRRLGAASLLHLVLGATAWEQARSQHAADTGEAAEPAGDAAADFRRGVEFLLTGLMSARG